MSDDIGGTEEVSAPEVIESQSVDLAKDLAADLYPEKKATDEHFEENKTDEPVSEELEEKLTEPEKQVRQPPKSWTKEMQTKYSALPSEVQDYVELREKQMSDGLEKDRGDANLGRVMRDTMTPYRAMLQAQGVDEVKAVQSLMNVHYKLTNLPMSEKAAYLQSIAQGYGIELGAATQGEAEIVDPTVKKLMDELNGIKQHLTTNQQNAITQAKEKVSRDVEAFASQENHPYFDEVADEIASFIQSGHDLDAAYEKAVWANPVTRQKELVRLQTEQGTELREKAKIAAEASKKAAGLNVKTRDTSRTPTGPRATMKNLDGALRESMAELKARTH